MRVLPEIDIKKLPYDVRSALAQLDLELSEGVFLFLIFFIIILFLFYLI